VNSRERAELSTILSGLLAQIHRLPARDVAAVMEVDERLRQGSVTASDLARLRTIAQGVP